MNRCREKGITTILSPAEVGEHAKYLERMGFVCTDENGLYRLDLEPSAASHSPDTRRPGL